MSSEIARPSVFTPFLRRFTDERARDLSDTITLYNQVGARHRSTVWSNPTAIGITARLIVEIIGESIPVPIYAPFAEALDRCLCDILALETTIFSSPEIDWSTAVLSLKEQIDLRRFLRAQDHFLANADRISTLLVDTLCEVFGMLIEALPELGAADAGPSFTVPLVALVADPGLIIRRITGTIAAGGLAESGLFATLWGQLYRNLCAGSGVAPEAERRKPLIDADQSDLSPVDLADTYLADMPLHDLFLCPVPFSIPDDIRFEHTHIVAGTGHGKTQTLQHLIAGDLSRPPDTAPSIVIIDSQGDMLAKIMQLDLFHPEHGPLADRLVIIDPTDIEHPPALGLFDLNLARVRGYDARYREQIMNGVIELYDYIFGGLLGAEMTQKQNVIFRYLARLMLAIPDATILTLKDVMQDSTPFVPYFDNIEGSARDFFRHDFNDRQFAETKKQILRRLWGVLENPTFERLFSHPRNKVDMFDALNTGKIVLVNTAKDFLKAERSSILGRFFIALTFQAALERAALPDHQRRPAFLYIDEAADYFDDTIDSLLSQARKFRLGVVFAHQYLDQLPRGLRASIMTNASIKLAGGVSSADAHALAPNMGTTHEFVAGVRKRRHETDFAAYVRNVTPAAITLSVPFGTLEAAPRMNDAALARVIARNRERYAASPGAPRQAATIPDTPRPVAVVHEHSADLDAADNWRS